MSSEELHRAPLMSGAEHLWMPTCKETTQDWGKTHQKTNSNNNNKKPKNKTKQRNRKTILRAQTELQIVGIPICQNANTLL